jgi:protein-disulfide isomerase
VSNSVKLTLAMIVAAVVVLVAALFLTNTGDDDTSTQPDQSAPGQTEESPSAGSGTAVGEPPLVRDTSPVLSEGTEAVFVEFLDFDCPACASFHPVVNDLRAEYGDRVAFVVRYVPLHPNSPNGFRAAEAAGLQGKYVEMYDMLFERQEERGGHTAGAVDEAPFFEYAEELGLDMDQFEEDFNSAEVTRRIEESLADAQEAGVQGTPTFFVDGQLLEPQVFDDLTKALDDALD